MLARVGMEQKCCEAGWKAKFQRRSKKQNRSNSGCESDVWVLGGLGRVGRLRPFMPAVVSGRGPRSSLQGPVLSEAKLQNPCKCDSCC